ncbi:hypothetical protein L6164_003121 [Bauhinia variegata]|uniref:Uncharacterized protein n=1 Tax=Bauhinia variegata TaxID=167791 RepID=A0ACB9PZU2_BAUVA|nr:hypothetical protein L6164_003121 [Bauhinia variegata]
MILAYENISSFTKSQSSELFYKMLFFFQIKSKSKLAKSNSNGLKLINSRLHAQIDSRDQTSRTKIIIFPTKKGAKIQSLLEKKCLLKSLLAHEIISKSHPWPTAFVTLVLVR